jgi:hypothetical protein
MWLNAGDFVVLHSLQAREPVTAAGGVVSTHGPQALAGHTPQVPQSIAQP